MAPGGLEAFNRQPDPEVVRAAFFYDAERKCLVWMRRPASRLKGRLFGAIAGHVHRDGYRYVVLNGTVHSAHRLTWIYHFGRIPLGLEIDHIDRDKSNNSIENLRLATREENMRNSDVCKRLTAPSRAVYRSRNRWRVIETANCRQTYIATFPTKEAALKHCGA